MRYTNMYSKIIVYQKYLVRSINVGVLRDSPLDDVKNCHECQKNIFTSFCHCMGSKDVGDETRHDTR